MLRISAIPDQLFAEDQYPGFIGNTRCLQWINFAWLIVNAIHGLTIAFVIRVSWKSRRVYFFSWLQDASDRKPQLQLKTWKQVWGGEFKTMSFCEDLFLRIIFNGTVLWRLGTSVWTFYQEAFQESIFLSFLHRNQSLVPLTYSLNIFQNWEILFWTTSAILNPSWIEICGNFWYSWNSWWWTFRSGMCYYLHAWLPHTE